MALEFDGAVHKGRRNVREDHRHQQDYAACDIALVTSQADDLRRARALERLMRLVALRLASCEEPGFMLLAAHFSAYTCAKLEEIGRGEMPCSRTSATQ